MNEALSVNGRLVLDGLALLRELVPIRRKRTQGADPEALVDELSAWHERRLAWGEQVQQAHAGGQWVALALLADRFSLQPREVDVLLIAIGPLVDPEFIAETADLRQGVLFRGVDVELVLGLLFHSQQERFLGRALLAPSGALVRNGLLVVERVGDALAPHEVEVRASSALANFILERPLLSDALSGFCDIIEPEHAWAGIILPDEQKELVWNLVSTEPDVRKRLDEWGYRKVMPKGGGVVLLFAGPPGTGKTAFAHAVAHRLERPLLRVRTSHLLGVREPILPLLTEIFRAAALADAVILLDDCEGLVSERSARFLAMMEALDSNEGLLVMTTNLAPKIDFAMARRILYRLDFEPPSSLLREQIWEVHLPPEAPLANDIDVVTLANTYEFTGAAIRNTVLIALAEIASHHEPELKMSNLVSAAETRLGARFDDLAVKAGVEVGLDRLVLPEDARAKLDEVLAACRHHEDVLNRWGFGKRLTTGRGICVLFDGPPGTGKTFTAEILAGALKLPLYRVHIPNIVSKWVGETERNIAEIFVRARSSRAMLLFDEADSLFGRRSTSASSANDRYANMEVNLLLQEIERYDGITVLTTNLFGNLDDALQRRIQFRVTFPFPEDAERGGIWKVLMPPEAPLGADVDFAELGRRFELAGGHIKNALLRAAYKAREDGGDICMRHLASAALAECEAQGKLVRSL